jgi:hypothetical protein
LRNEKCRTVTCPLTKTLLGLAPQKKVPEVACLVIAKSDSNVTPRTELSTAGKEIIPACGHEPCRYDFAAKFGPMPASHKNVKASAAPVPLPAVL